MYEADNVMSGFVGCPSTGLEAACILV